MTNTIDAKILAKMFLAGAKNLESQKEWINDLNVFPVPDGDTGTNMTLTIMSAAKDVAAMDNPDMISLCKAISSGSLRGARGNSGVILSQLFRGFTKSIREKDVLDIPVFADAFEKAVETAYKAVMKPKEGTILTVAKGASIRARELAEEGCTDLGYFFDEVIKYADEVLERTPEMLPVLKQAGVVDSGGQGLMQVLKGAYNAFLGKETEFTPYEDIALDSQVVSETSDIDTADIKFGYCTEFIIMLEKHYDEEEERSFKAYLESIGDSLVVVSDDDIVKIHVHTNDPGLAIQKALTYGSLTRMKIDNMREEHHERLIKDAEKKAAEQKAADKAREEALRAKEPRKKYGFISVSIGDGINEIFNGLGVDYIIEGGQTMNPSTEDILNAIDSVNADTVYVFPNNKNIILAANQAETLVEDKKVIVIPSKTIPQGITAIINFIPEKSPEENAGNMIEEMNRVKTGQVTYAVRDTELDGFSVKENDIMGIGDTGIVSVGTDIKSATIDMIDSLIDEESELISIYYGADVTKEDADNIAAELKAKYTAVEFEVNYGGQPIYYYVVSVE